MSDWTEAQKRIEMEAEALRELAATDQAEAFELALDILSSAWLIVTTGVGKSGLIARKIAATMTSLGSPAVFVDPVAAAHGDLGLIAAGCVVIALSKSGDTVELGPILSRVEQLGIGLIGITARSESALAQAASATLIIPPGEADPRGLAPTSSTTAMVALGDALALALADRAGFSRADFAQNHPGGWLGTLLQVVG